MIKFLVNIKLPNKACTRQVGVCAIYEHFSSFEFFLLLGRVHARPLAGNANRCAAPCYEKYSYNSVTFIPCHVIAWGDGVMETRSFESLLGFDSQAPKGIRNLVPFGASESAK